MGIDQFRAGRFGEFLGLTIEAGFEIGVEAAGNLFQSLLSLIGTSSFWAGLGNALLTAVNESLKAISALIIRLETPFDAVAIYARDAFVYGFGIAVNSFAAGLEKTINAAVRLLNEKLGTSLAEVTVPRVGV